MTSFDQPWQPHLDWSAPAGRVLDRLVDALPANHRWEIIVFGSAPLQLGVDARFLSGDVDVIASEDITMDCERAGLLKGQSAIYVEPCTVAAFTASPDWFVRAYRCERRHVTFTFPHPIDILVSKIKRMEKQTVDDQTFRMSPGGHLEFTRPRDGDAGGPSRLACAGRARDGHASITITSAAQP